MTSDLLSRRIVLFDGECRMCSGWARFVSARDPRGELELVPQQSDEGREILARHGLPLDDMSTMVFVDGDAAWTKSTGVLRVLGCLPMPWPLAGVIRIVPRVLRDAVYDAIARNRRRIFGAQKCEWAPPKERG
ncbi:MAG: DCC1-like thiol-disulfide oxidoreductase family protein [Thermoanaerobaculia bacterium]|jgi:predicted DCC family thiol-disulfide oxidoreductase YuxK